MKAEGYGPEDISTEGMTTHLEGCASVTGYALKDGAGVAFKCVSQEGVLTNFILSSAGFAAMARIGAQILNK